MSTIMNYYPEIYKELAEIQSLVNVEDLLFDDVDDQIVKFKNNQYVRTCDEEGISNYERQLGIIANTGAESLEFRKRRVINRLSFLPPFTFRYLKNRLDSIIGEGKWNSYIDFSNYTLYIESSAENQIWFNEVRITINRLKPANIVFINTPLISEGIILSEKIQYSQTIKNYLLGVSWVLGAKSFVTLEDRGYIKLATESSLQEKYLNDVATFSSSQISSVLLNDELAISEITKTVDGNILTVEYLVPGTTAESITDIKIIDSEENVLASSVVYVPLVDDVTIKHTFLIKEGE